MGEHYLVSDYKTRNSTRNKHNGMDFVGKKGDYDIYWYSFISNKEINN